MRRSLGGTDCFTALLVSAAGLIAQATPPLGRRATTECNGRLGLAIRINKAGEAQRIMPPLILKIMWAGLRCWLRTEMWITARGGP